MPVVVAGVNHWSAPLAIREHLAFVPDALPEALLRLRSVVDEGFILSTCNRVEVYGLATSADVVHRFLVQRGNPLTAALMSPFIYCHEDEEAVRHLFRVAAGVDSVVLGEREILGQLRKSLEAARQAGALGPTLARLGGAAVRAAKRAHARTAIGRNPISLVSLGLRAAADVGAAAAGSSALVLGAGPMAESVLWRLSRDRPGDLALTSRTADRAHALAQRFGARVVSWDQRATGVANADLLIACTSSPEPVLTAEQIGTRAGRRLVCVDLGVPRDVEHAVRMLPGVRVIDLERLEAVAAANRAQRLVEVREAESLLAAEARHFMAMRLAHATGAAR